MPTERVSRYRVGVSTGSATPVDGLRAGRRRSALDLARRPRAEEGDRDVQVLDGNEPDASRRPARRAASAAIARAAASGRRKPRKRRRRSSRTDATGRGHAERVTDLCQKRTQEMERRGGRPAADRLAVAGQIAARAPAPRPGRTRAGRRARPASRASRRRALRCPVTETATSAPSDSRAPSGHRGRGLGRDGAVRRERLLAARRAGRASRRCRRPRSRPGRRRSRRAPTSAAPRRARRCRTPRSPSERPALARQVEHELLDRPVVLGEDRRAERAPKVVRQLLAPRRRARPRSRPRARRSSPARPRALPRPRRAPARPPTRSPRTRAGRAAQAPRARASTRRTASSSSAACQSLRSSGGGPGQDDGDRAARLDDEPRSRPGDPDHAPAGGHRRLLADALLELRVRPPEPLRDPPRDALDLLLELLGDRARAPPPGQQLDGAVVVRRPEPSRKHEQVGVEPFADRRLEPAGRRRRS